MASPSTPSDSPDMDFLPATTGAVVVTEADVDPNLERVAASFGLSILAAANADLDVNRPQALEAGVEVR